MARISMLIVIIMVVCGMSTQPALAENHLAFVESNALIVEAYDGDTVIGGGWII